MRILMLAAHPHIRSPIPKHTPPLVAALRQLGCSVQVEGWGRRREGEALKTKIAGRVADIRRIRGMLQAQHFDMLVVKTAHDWNTVSRDIALLLATPGLCAHRVLQFHGSLADRLVVPGHVLFKLASALLLRFCDATLVLSSEEKRDLLSFHPSGRVYVVKNPLPAPALPLPPRSQLRANLGLADDVAVLLFVGRLMDHKGLWELLAALPAVSAHRPCHLVLAGEGPARDRLRQRAAADGLAPLITFAGYLEGGALQAAYAGADVFVLPSRWEGFPLSVLEAMDAGLPVVTTRIRGMADHLQDDVHALMIPPGDVAALAHALRRILADGELRARMRRANREKAREFAPDIVGREYLAVLRAVADSRP